LPGVVGSGPGHAGGQVARAAGPGIICQASISVMDSAAAFLAERGLWSQIPKATTTLARASDIFRALALIIIISLFHYCMTLRE